MTRALSRFTSQSSRMMRSSVGRRVAPLATWPGTTLAPRPVSVPARHPAQSPASAATMVPKMDRAGDSDGMLVALRGASVLGIQLVDAADVYAWGLTREFAALRAVCCARLGSTSAGHANRPPAPSSRTYLRRVVGDAC